MGCGNSGKLIYEYVTEMGYTDKITCFADNNEKNGVIIFASD